MGGTILLPMWEDPAEYWRGLRDLYGKKSDDELRELAFDFDDLTEVARQVLRDEMRTRKLGEPRAAVALPLNRDRPAPAQQDGGDAQSKVADGDSAGEFPPEYTWKTMLCECEERAQAWQMFEVLRQAGIESWVERPRSPLAPSSRRVLVAADQLEGARLIAERPIPQEIVDLTKMEVPEFEPPVCPSCGAGDVVLDDVNPVNLWRCETCGRQWTDAAGDLNANTEKTEA